MKEIDETRLRMTAMAICLGIAIVWIVSLTLVLGNGEMSAFLLDRQSTHFPYPFTIQNVMWLMFFISAGEIYVRYWRGSLEASQLGKGLLPEDDQTMLQLADLGDLNATAQQDRGYFLQRLIGRCILQFQSSKSINQSNALLNSSLELMQHEVDTRYSMIRYLVWLVPTLGFIGTVVGIALALSDASAADDFQDPELMKVLTASLGVAFYTTLLALIQSAILVFALHIAQAKEELTLNRAGQYCLDNLINRLYER